jgi:hypothetical protein
MVDCHRITLKTGPNPPPICPRCGSHRTEIVGLSEDGRTLTLRCNACGQRSTVPLEPEACASPVPAAGNVTAALDPALSIDGVSEMFGPCDALADSDLEGVSEMFGQPNTFAEPDLDGVAELFDQADTLDESDLAVDDLQQAACDDVPFESLVRTLAEDLRRVAAACQLA